MIPRSINRNRNRNLNKSIGILIGTRTNQSESQSEPEQSIPHAVVARFVHGVKEHKIGGLCSHVGLGKIYITRSNARAQC